MVKQIKIFSTYITYPIIYNAALGRLHDVASLPATINKKPIKTKGKVTIYSLVG